MGFLGFAQNEEVLQCPLRNYFEKLMQTSEIKEKKKERKKIDLYALLTTTRGLVDKYEAALFSASPPRQRPH